MRTEAWAFAWKRYVTRLVEPGSSSFMEDEAALRRILRETPMEGVIRMAFTREPHFFCAKRRAFHLLSLPGHPCGER